jgi:hypothetical protein
MQSEKFGFYFVKNVEAESLVFILQKCEVKSLVLRQFLSLVKIFLLIFCLIKKIKDYIIFLWKKLMI